MISRAARRLLSLNNNAIRLGFCVNKAHLDPFKHTTMNHSPHNMFVDLYDFGEYPEVILPASIAPRTYQPIVVSTAVEVLNQRYVFLPIISRALTLPLTISITTLTNHGSDSLRRISTLMQISKKS